MKNTATAHGAQLEKCSMDRSSRRQIEEMIKKRPMKVMEGTSARDLSVSMAEAAESASGCESGSHRQECHAARGFVTGPRVLALPRAPEFDFRGRASHLEHPPSTVEYLAVCEMGHRVLRQVSRVRSLLSLSNPILESCGLLSLAVRYSLAMGNKQFSSPRVGFHPISPVVIGARRCTFLNAV